MRNLWSAVILFGCWLFSACDENQREYKRGAPEAPLSIVVNFVESTLQGDSSLFYHQIDKDSLFETICRQATFRPGFSPCRLHDAYFGAYGPLVHSPFADKYFPKHIGMMESRVLEMNDSTAEYSVKWTVIHRKGQGPDPWSHQRFRLRKQPWGGDWKITFAEFQLLKGAATNNN